MLFKSDSTALAEGNFVISKEDDLNCFLTPWKKRGNNRWPVAKIMALFCFEFTEQSEQHAMAQMIMGRSRPR